MIAQRIRELRKSLKLTQEEFGRRLGCGRYVISNIEYERVPPKKVFLDHIVKIYGVNPLWLHEGTGEMFEGYVPETKREISEAMDVFQSLNPKLQEYALAQMRGLLELQKSGEPDEKE